MAQIRYRANLSAKDFVFSAQQWGRSVVMKQYDQNFSRQIVSPTDPDKDIGIPQIFYCHNVMPAAQGFQSVGINQIFPNTGVTGNPWQVLHWENNGATVAGGSSGGANTFGYFLITKGTPSGGFTPFNVYACQGEGSSATWTFLATISTVHTTQATFRWTCATINGLTYVYIPFIGCYVYDGVTWQSQTLTGLTATSVFGITESFGYLLAWGYSSVSWSSTISPTDFTPSLITGAGGGSVQGIKGPITYCKHHTFGFVVFSQKNCVAAVYSGNARYPFNFREVIGGGGFFPSTDLVDLDSESGNLYAWTNAGLQIVSVTQAQVVHPELTNYVGGSRFEDFDDVALVFNYTDVTLGSMAKQIAVVSNRYLVISYASAYTVGYYTHAFVYDISMKRWGKLKFNHMQAVDAMMTNPGNSTQDNARASFCLLGTNSALYQVDFSNTSATGGTIILGKYQHARDRLITLDQIDMEYIPSPSVNNVYDMTTLDGKTFQTPVQLTPITVGTNAPQYPTRLTGMNHSIILQGVWQLESLMITYTANGRR